MKVLIFECQVSSSKLLHVLAAEFNAKTHTDLMKDKMLLLVYLHVHHGFCYYSHIIYIYIWDAK